MPSQRPLVNPDAFRLYLHLRSMAKSFYRPGDWQPNALPDHLDFMPIEKIFLKNPERETEPPLIGTPHITFKFLHDLGFEAAAHLASGTSAHVYVGRTKHDKVYALRVPQEGTDHEDHQRDDTPMGLQTDIKLSLLDPKVAHALEVLPLVPVVSYDDPGLGHLKEGFNLLKKSFWNAGINTYRAMDMAVLPDVTVLIADPDNCRQIDKVFDLPLALQCSSQHADKHHSLHLMTQWIEEDGVTPKQERFFPRRAIVNP